MSKCQNVNEARYDTFIKDYRREALISIAVLADLIKTTKGRKGVQVLREEVEETMAQHETFRNELEQIMQDINMVAAGLKSMRSLERKLTLLCENGWRQEYKSWPLPSKDNGMETIDVQVGEEQPLHEVS